MKAESVAFAVAGMCFGVILGWVLATQDANRPREFQQPQAPAAAPAATNQPPAAPPPPPLDAERVRALQSAIEKNPRDAGNHALLGNAYYDAEQWTDAIEAYKRSLALDPNNVDVSTDLGVSYFRMDRSDDALAQFEHSLKVNPNHTKTLLNKGVVLAFGKRNLEAAADTWKKLVEIAPDSPEGQAARRGLEEVAAAQARQGTTNQ